MNSGLGSKHTSSFKWPVSSSSLIRPLVQKDNSIHIIKYFPLIYYFPTQPSANSAKVGDEVELTGIFKNPLQVPLTKGHFLVQATRMKPRTIRFDCK